MNRWFEENRDNRESTSYTRNIKVAPPFLLWNTFLIEMRTFNFTNLKTLLTVGTFALYMYISERKHHVDLNLLTFFFPHYLRDNLMYVTK